MNNRKDKDTLLPKDSISTKNTDIVYVFENFKKKYELYNKQNYLRYLKRKEDSIHEKYKAHEQKALNLKSDDTEFDKTLYEFIITMLIAVILFMFVSFTNYIVDGKIIKGNEILLLIVPVLHYSIKSIFRDMKEIISENESSNN